MATVSSAVAVRNGEDAGATVDGSAGGEHLRQVGDDEAGQTQPVASNESVDSTGADDDLRRTYRHVLKFYKDNEGKSVHLSYDDRLHLVALSQQAAHGKLVPENLPPLGALDVIGRDRRKAWSELGDLSREDAMKRFVDKASNLFPHLQPYLAAHQTIDEEHKREQAIRAEAEEESRRRQEAERREAEQEEDHQRRLDHERRRLQEQQRRRIQDALNAQTYLQFRDYASKQFPNNPDQQAVLVRQLQEQHYTQYMQQIYQQQMETHANATLSNHMASTSISDVIGGKAMKNLSLNEDDDGHVETKKMEEGRNVINEDDNSDEEQPNDHDNDDNCDDDDDDDDDEDGYSGDAEDIELPVPSMWTKKDLAEFKASIRAEGGDGIIKVGHGETVTVRVPTHPEGSALFWEFATDSYDIAFGLFFEWTQSDNETEVSVVVSESEDEDLDDAPDGDVNDPETASASEQLMNKGPPTSVVVPIYRRDCHQEVYVGTHQYPSRGVYLLKFDNTYSLWRSKTLYYRVFYTP